jgi:hypothetical protein
MSGLEAAGQTEQRQALTLARAAAKTSTLEHYIWSTLPSAKALTNGKHPCAHLDWKAEADDIIRKELPDLAAKTTFLIIGFYAQNYAFMPQVKPFEFVSDNPCRQECTGN